MLSNIIIGYYEQNQSNLLPKKKHFLEPPIRLLYKHVMSLKSILVQAASVDAKLALVFIFSLL